MKKITIVIYSVDHMGAEAHMPQIAAALSRGDEAMALLATRRRPVPMHRRDDAGEPMEDVLERVEYWSEDVAETPTGPPTWGREAHGIDAAVIRDGKQVLVESLRFHEAIMPGIRTLGFERDFKWEGADHSGSSVRLIATTARGARLLALL